MYRYTGKVEGVPAVLSVPPAAAHGNQTGTAFIPEERQANTEAPSQHDGIPKTALQTQDELDGGHPDTSHPSELSTKIDALQTKTATVMHRLERIETPKEMRDEGNDGNQVFSNVAPAPETPLSGAIQIHGPTVLSGPGEDSETRNITEVRFCSSVLLFDTDMQMSI